MTDLKKFIALNLTLMNNMMNKEAIGKFWKWDMEREMMSTDHLCLLVEDVKMAEAPPANPQNTIPEVVAASPKPKGKKGKKRR